MDTLTLEQHGFLLYRLETNTHDAVCDAMRDLARTLGGSADLVTLDSDGDPRSLPIHTEGVYRSMPPRYFMLGCVNPSATGGNTIIYDARKAARLVRRERPELADVSIVYASKAHGVAAEHQLVRLAGPRTGLCPYSCSETRLKAIVYRWCLRGGARSPCTHAFEISSAVVSLLTICGEQGTSWSLTTTSRCTHEHRLWAPVAWCV